MKINCKIKGFTLLEVMVALVIIAVSLGAISENNVASTRNAIYLKNKNIALLIAQNKMVETRIHATWPSISQRTGFETMLNQEWFWVRKVSSTEDQLLRRIDISVALNEQRDDVLYRLSGFMAAP